MNLPDIAEVWRRGSVIGSWLLDLTAGALPQDPQLAAYGGRVSDSGEGRWTIEAAIDEGVPAHVLSAALFERFSVARRGRLRRPGALGDAPRVRRPRREARRGRRVSGSRARPQRRGAARGRRARRVRLHRRSRAQEDLPGALRDGRSSGTLTVPVIGVASSSLDADELHARVAREPRQRRRHRRPAAFDQPALARCATSAATTASPATFEALKSALGRRAAAGALPRDPAGAVRDRDQEPRRRRAGRRTPASSSRSRSAATSRRRVELERGRALGVSGGVDLPHRPLPRQGGDHEPPLFPLRQLLPRADLEPQPRRQRADHARRGLRHRRARRLLRERGRAARRRSRTTCSRSSRCWRWSRRRIAASSAVHGEKAGVFHAMRPLDARRPRARPVRRLPQRAGRRRRLRRRDLLRACASSSTRGAGPACRGTCAPASACRRPRPRCSCA